MNTHLSDDTLNEYLDYALAGSARFAVAAHLAGCSECTARLGRLASLFANLEALPDAPLGHNLHAGVMSAVRAKAPAALRPIADPRRPAFKAIFVLQTVLALALLAFAWPFAWPLITGLALPVPPSVAADLGKLVPAWPDPGSLWTGLVDALGSVTPPVPAIALRQPFAAALLLIAAALFWLAGNALLLRRRPAANTGRRA